MLKLLYSKDSFHLSDSELVVLYHLKIRQSLYDIDRIEGLNSLSEEHCITCMAPY